MFLDLQANLVFQILFVFLFGLVGYKHNINGSDYFHILRISFHQDVHLQTFRWQVSFSNLKGVEHDEDVMVDFVFRVIHSQDSKEPGQDNRQHKHNRRH